MVKAISADTVAGLLDRALLLLQFSAALRVSELVDLKVNDVARHSEGIVLVAAGKAANLEGERSLPSIARIRTARSLSV